MFKITRLILITLFALLALVSCAPTLKQADTQVVMKLEGQQLVLTGEAPIAYGYGALLGKITSRFCAGQVTEKPRVCPQQESGWVALDIPQMEYPKRLVIGTVQGQVKDGFFDVALSGARVTYRAELKR